MNKQSFIERLNLHLDGELSEDESAELLSIIKDNPEYHRIYVQYCQIFNACSLLGEKFSPAKPQSAWKQKVYAVGGMAAAAALLFMAARNLSPIFSDFGGSEETALASVGVVSGKKPTSSVEPAMVVGSPNFSQPAMLLTDSALPASFDPKAFLFTGTENHNLGFNDEVTYSPRRTSSRPGVANGFSLQKAINTSTFAHEEMTAVEEEAELFDIDSIGSGLEGQKEGVLFDLSGAAATSTLPRN